MSWSAVRADCADELAAPPRTRHNIKTKAGKRSFMARYQHALNRARLQIGLRPDFASDFIRHAQHKLLIINAISAQLKFDSRSIDTRNSRSDGVSDSFVGDDVSRL